MAAAASSGSRSRSEARKQRSVGLATCGGIPYAPAMKTISLVLAALCFFHGGDAGAADGGAPAGAFDLRKWKLQIPGPKEIKLLQNYSSDYFHLNAKREMCFQLDAAEKGTTENAHYVRSELRHMLDWGTGEAHSMSGEFRVISSLSPDKVTALQIHGITEQGGDAPPLLRIAVTNGDLVAFVKTDNDGEQTENVPLKKQVKDGWVKVDVVVKNRQLKISVDHQVKFQRSLAFWKFKNYFKAGCYPQATEGKAEVFFRKLSAE